ncbi:uncharacterized protein LOC105398513 [Plutella xylostella]|uniref:uncharacterized protein LOC105398513 n=1 Tax=Plutella xylostella TaxID=51655 RepID=UPI002033133B|nr:uncharacterized protein LOC105398513 [Plutella xylostella]
MEKLALITVIQNLISNSAVNVRFAQLQPTDTKFQVLRQQMVRANTKNLVYHCRGDQLDCSAALARMRYKASKHFYALAKAVVDYVKNRRQARPTGYVGTATFCQDSICVPDTDPPIVLGGCSALIGCGGNASWHLDPVDNYKKSRRIY